MDSFFKAAVCDLDKLLDDFEHNTEEPDCKSVFLKPPAYSLSTLGSQGLSSEASTGPQKLPDLNSLHYGFSPICPDRLTSQNHNSGISEVEGQQLTDVDLLSSVDRRQVKGCVPPCPDRALKPVCDLVNDTSSAIRGSSHDTFGELDMVEKQMEEEEALLVDFSSPVVAALGEELQELSFGDMDTEIQQASAGKVELPGLILCDTVGGYSASLSLLDVILPAAIERVCESADESMSKRTTELAKEEEDGAHKMGSHQSVNSLNHCEQVDPLPENPTNDNITTEDFTKDKTHEQLDSYEADSLAAPTTSENDPVGLSCFPIAVSMCGALVNSKNSTEGSVEVSAMGKKTEMPECKEADSVSTLTARMDGSNANELINIAVPFSLQPAEGSASTNEEPVSLESPYTTTLKHTSSERAEPSTAESADFGFEYLPEPDQAELLVTDEELDAFLQAHSGAEHFDGGFLCSMSGEYGHHKDLSDLSGDLEQKLVEEELRSRGQQDTPENMNSPEKEMTNECVEESLKPKLSSFSPDLHSSYQIEPEISSQVTHSINPIQSQHSVSPDLHSYGGARPKQLHCLVSPSPAETGLPVQMFDSVTDQSTVEDEENPASPCHPPPSHSSNFEPGLVHEPHRNHNNDGYDELSEPPPYPGEPSGNDANSMDETEEGLGCRQPAWVPDSEAPNCMNCTQRFTFTKRRHHCRACGKVFCAVCCSRKCKLKYLEKEARVCLICFDTIHRAQALERMMSPTGPSPNPNVPSEYCSTIPPLQQARAAGTLNSPPPTVMVPVSVLKHPTSDGCPREQKRVWFADGILPNGEVADTTKLSVTGRRSPQECSPVATEPPAAGPGGPEVQVGGSSAPESSGAEGVRPPLSGPWDYALLCGINSSEHKGPSLLPDEEEELPPLLITTGDDEVGDVLVEERPAPCQILLLLEEGGPRPLTFLLNATLLINVKLVTYCSRRCWCFGSNGLRALGQRELAFVLECLPDEKTLPKDLFMLYLNIYQDAQKGKFVEDLGNVTFTSSFLGSKEHGGMLFFSPTCQPLEDLSLPPQPFLFGLLIQRLEVPWAKVFPLRLLLRLGAEHSMYPTTTVSIRFRESVYRETGHTIMNLLADLRNYQYSLPVVEGLRIHMEVGHSYIDIPKSSYNEMLKVVNSSNEHVISVGASLSLEADSHLVCFQNDDGNYQTQSNSMPGKNRTVTGASFVVFNGALKASSGFIAKSSIVEDGLMVQIPPDTMEALRTALREKTDFLIPCGRSDAEELRENVTVRWLDWTAPVNVGVTSGVDGRSLAGVQSVRMQQDTEFESEGHSMRCTEVFYQLRSPDVCLATVLPTCDGFQREMALATCSALSPHLAVLASSGINSLSLRFSTQSEMVQYQAGSRSQLLPQRYMNELDSALIPVIHGGSASVPQIAMDMEFHFYITNAI